MALAELPDLWRQRAETVRDLTGDPDSPAARVWERAAIELTQALRAFDDGTLNLTEAAQVSGYTADHLGALVRSGKLPNAGRANAPRIRRTDLPIKNGKQERPRKPQTDRHKDYERFANNLNKRTDRHARQ